MGMGKARRGSGGEGGPTLRAAPGAGHSGGAPCLLPPGSSLSVPEPRRASDSRGREPQAQNTGSSGGLSGWEFGEGVFWGKGDTAGILYLELGVMICGMHPLMTGMEKKVVRIGLIDDKRQELSCQCPEHPTSASSY